MRAAGEFLCFLLISSRRLRVRVSSCLRKLVCAIEMLRGLLRRWPGFCGREQALRHTDTNAPTTRAGPPSTCACKRFVDCVWPPVFSFDLLALPRPLALAVLSHVPVDTRLRCCEVNRAWRALLLETSLWSRLDFSDESGCAVFSKAVFCAALLKAGRQVRVLDVTWSGLFDVRYDALVAALEAMEATAHLLELECGTISSSNKLLQLTNVVSKLRVLRVVGIHFCTQDHAHDMLGNHPPY